MRKKPSTDPPGDTTPAIEKLSLRQRALVRAYTDPESPTFGNQTQSYIRAYGTNSYTGSASSATQLLQNNANVALAIREEIARHGLGPEVRIGMARTILEGRHRAKTRIVTRKDSDGSTVTEVESTPRAQDIVKTLQLLDRWDGSEAARTAQAQAHAQLLVGLTRRIMATIDTPTPRKTRRRTHVAAASAPDAGASECKAEDAHEDARTGA